MVVLAQEEARLLGHGHIGTEHLLLALLHDDGPTAAALHRQSVTLHDLRAAVETRVGRSDNAPSGHIPFTPNAKTALEMSLREALHVGHNYIAGPHLLLGLLRVEDGRAFQLLADRHIDLAGLRNELLDHATSNPAHEPAGPPFGPTLAGFTVADLHHELSQLRAELAALRSLIEQRLPPPPQEPPTH